MSQLMINVMDSSNVREEVIFMHTDSIFMDNVMDIPQKQAF